MKPKKKTKESPRDPSPLTYKFLPLKEKNPTAECDSLVKTPLRRRD